MSEFYEKFKNTNDLIYLHLAYLNGYKLVLKLFSFTNHIIS
jgi:hypothetical protein